MGDKTAIEWTDATWGPVTGCTKVSAGCDNCYAETLAERFRGTPGHYYEHGFDVQLRPEKLDQPLRWRRPRRIFVNSMSDLFHDSVPDGYIAKVFAVMALAPQHTFQVLTKRHARMRSLLAADDFIRGVRVEARRFKDREWASREYPQGKKAEDASRWEFPAWPLPNVWLGVSAENQQWADIRIPALLDTPAAVRFVSAEPLLGPIKLPSFCDCGCNKPAEIARSEAEAGVQTTLGINWVIVGGESGPGARPMHPDWARSLRDQCQAAGVAFHFKQFGEWVEANPDVDEHWVGRRQHILWPTPEGTNQRPIGFRRVGKLAAGRELDGRTWDQYPEAVTP